MRCEYGLCLFFLHKNIEQYWKRLVFSWCLRFLNGSVSQNRIILPYSITINIKYRATISFLLFMYRTKSLVGDSLKGSYKVIFLNNFYQYQPDCYIQPVFLYIDGARCAGYGTIASKALRKIALKISGKNNTYLKMTWWKSRNNNPKITSDFIVVKRSCGYEKAFKEWMEYRKNLSAFGIVNLVVSPIWIQTQIQTQTKS